MDCFLRNGRSGCSFWKLLLVAAWLLALDSYAATPPLRLVPRGQLVCGSSFVLNLRADGSAYGWGRNNFGQLGDGTTNQQATPVSVIMPPGVRLVQLAAGGAHSLGVATDGRVYGWGYNTSGQLGDGTATSRSSLAAVTLPPGIRFVQVAAGGTHSLGLAADGTVYAWGGNALGQLGDGTTVARLQPVAVAMPVGVRCTQVVAGASFSLALTATGTAYAWGDNASGQLGDGTTTAHSVPSAVALPVGVQLTSLAAGMQHTLAVAATGVAYAWGTNANGELGIGSGNYQYLTPQTIVPAPGVRFVQVAAGNSTQHSLALAADGTVYSWGFNIYGQLGNGTTTNQDRPAPVALPVGIRFTQLSSGLVHSAGLGANGEVYTWGTNVYGQLGDGTNTQQNMPTRALLPTGPLGYTQASGGYYHSIALRADGTAWAWGSNQYGQLGDNSGATHPLPVAVLLPAGVRFVQVAAGNYHTVALAADGTAYGWGSNQYGQVGTNANFAASSQPAPVPVALPTGVRLVQVAAGSNHSLGLAADGAVYAWGINNNYQLGDGSSSTTRTTPVAVPLPTGVRIVQVAAGLWHSLALAADGTVYTWGDNTVGQLGAGAIGTLRMTPQAVVLPAGVIIKQVAAGNEFCLALAADGTAYAWGSNASGQLGIGNITSQPTPVAVAMPAGIRFQQLGVGYAHALALSADGSIYAWGHGIYGQLGTNSFSDTALPVREVSGLTTWTGVTVSSISDHSLVLGPNGTVYSAGYNRNGQLGDGSTTDSPVFIRTQIPLPTHAALTAQAFAAQLFPNPSTGSVAVEITTAQAGPTTFTLLDALGRPCLLLTMPLSPGANQVTLSSVAALASGLYLLRIQQGHQLATIRLIRQ